MVGCPNLALSHLSGVWCFIFCLLHLFCNISRDDHQKSKKTKREEEKRGIELNLGKKSKGDEWTGRVLDIVKRVNNNTNTVIVKMNEEIEAVKKQNDSLEKKVDHINQQNSNLQKEIKDQNDNLNQQNTDLKNQIDHLKERNSAILSLLREKATT